MNTEELVVSEWINSAQEDLDGIALTSQVPLLAHTCYHCGLAVEKMLKAYIIAKETKLIKTHDLNVLLEKCEKHSSDFGRFKDICIDITLYATLRYPPGRNLTREKM
jgi:HEPN domain-containing protein